MRFLAWSLLKLDDERVSLETWTNEVRSKYGLGKEMDATFVLSLVGILYDLTQEKRDNKSKRLIAIEVKNIISQIINRDESPQKTTG
ncbi:hypothetical protein JXA59_00430 [Patescibacteria group bacterium]|nr:hypothetical protein [Patescibacteria group bacterium]